MTGFLILAGGVLALAWGQFVIAGEVAADPRRPRARSAARRCPYCHGPAEGAPQRCPSCATQHHLACWEEHGGCSVFGCRAAGPVTRRGAQAVEEAPPAEEVEVAQGVEEEVSPGKAPEATASEPEDSGSGEEDSGQDSDRCQGRPVAVTPAG